MNKRDTFQQIAELIELQEKAIQQHPTATAAVYVKGRDAFIEGQRSASETEWSRSMALTLGELSLMHRYLLSSSFISGWYHLAGDKGRRDEAAHSCSLLVASLGPDPEAVMRKYVEYERLWRRIMTREGIAPRRFRPIGVIVLLAIIVAVLLFLLKG